MQLKMQLCKLIKSAPPKQRRTNLKTQQSITNQSSLWGKFGH